MPRQARKVFPGLPHHVVQRGNRRQDVFFCTEDREFYLELLRRYSEIYSVSTLAYCLMTNHVHFILVPSDITGLKRLLGVVNSQYALRINKRYRWQGHLWQERFFSCPLGDGYLRAAVRYVELNPVRAKMVQLPQHYSWSSAHSRITDQKNPNIQSTDYWNSLLPKAEDWIDFLKENDGEVVKLIRRNLSKNLPIGSDEFINNLEKISGRSLKYRPQGRPKKLLIK